MVSLSYIPLIFISLLSLSGLGHGAPLRVRQAAAEKTVVAHFMVGNSFSYTPDVWTRNIKAAMDGGIQGFALNVGSDSFQPARVADGFKVAQSLGFKMFFSFDMSAMACQAPGDADLLRKYINDFAKSPAHLLVRGKPLVSTFAGEACTFGQAGLNAAWKFALRSAGVPPVTFVPSFFADPATFAANDAMDGDFNWNGGWPPAGVDVNFDSDTLHQKFNAGKVYMAAVSPLFFTHYSPQTFNKNFIFRSDNHLYNTRWEQLIANRNTVDVVEIATWNDYGESHYIGPIEKDQPNSEAWVNGFDHTGFTAMTKIYADAFRTGQPIAIPAKNQIFLSARPHAKDAKANDPIGLPTRAEFTEDALHAVVFATTAGSVDLSLGAAASTTPIKAGINKVKLPLKGAGSAKATFKDGTGKVLVDFAPAGFTFTADAAAFNFNYRMAASP